MNFRNISFVAIGEWASLDANAHQDFWWQTEMTEQPYNNIRVNVTYFNVDKTYTFDTCSCLWSLKK
jgi:hypothetical protein